jgi:hypothetical protein
VTTADAISVIVVILRHMRFLFFYDQQKSDEDLTGKVRGLFPRAAKEIEIYPDSSIVRKTACHGAIFGFVMGHDLRRLFVSR